MIHKIRNSPNKGTTNKTISRIKAKTIHSRNSPRINPMTLLMNHRISRTNLPINSPRTINRVILLSSKNNKTPIMTR